MWSTNQARATRTNTPKSERKKSAIRFPIESKSSPMRRTEAGEANAPPLPFCMNIKRKDLQNLQFVSDLILKDAILVVSEVSDQPQKKEKREQAPALQTQFFLS